MIGVSSKLSQPAVKKAKAKTTAISPVKTNPVTMPFDDGNDIGKGQLVGMVEQPSTFKSGVATSVTNNSSAPKVNPNITNTPIQAEIAPQKQAFTSVMAQKPTTTPVDNYSDGNLVNMEPIKDLNPITAKPIADPSLSVTEPDQIVKAMQSYSPTSTSAAQQIPTFEAPKLNIPDVQIPELNVSTVGTVDGGFTPAPSKPQYNGGNASPVSLGGIATPTANIEQSAGFQKVGGVDVANLSTTQGNQFGGDAQINSNLNSQPRYNIQAGRDTFSGGGAGDFGRFEDLAMQNASRQLDPMWQEREKSFEQQMINQGVTPGTEAYDAARANFDRSRNDAYNDATFSAMQFGLGAQNQAFNQDATTYGLNSQDKYNSLATAMQAAGLNEGARQFDTNTGFRDQQQSFQNQNQLDSQNEDVRRFDASFNNNVQQQDFGNRLNSANFLNSQNQFNAQLGENARQFDTSTQSQYDQLGAQIANMNSQNKLNASSLNESMRQFDAGMGLNYDNLGEQQRQFDAGMGLNYDSLNTSIEQFNNQFGLQAQNQLFNQGFAADQFNLGAQNQQFNQELAANQFNLGAQNQSFGQGMATDQFNLGAQNQFFNQNFAGEQFDEDTRRFNNTNDFSQFMQLDNMNRAYNDQSYRDAVFNASREDQRYNQLVSAMMGMQPQSGAQPIDVMGAYNMQNNAAMNQYNNQYNQAQQNQAGFNQLLGTGAQLAGMYFMSDRSYKDEGKPIDKEQLLVNIRNLDVEQWNYKGDKVKYIGAYAQEFNEAINNDSRTDQINVINAIGALTASIQVLADKVEALEAAA